MQSQSRDTGTDSKQDRSEQPCRLEGGNSSRSEVATEKHQQKRGTRIKQGGGGGELQGSTTGTNRSWFNEREGGGNSVASASQEKHNQPKNEGKHFRGGQLVGPAEAVDSNIQVSERRHGAGNDRNAPSEPALKAKRATRLDISTAHRFDSRT
jgi:hypothetical protein